MRTLITASFLIICGIAHAGSPLVLYCTASELQLMGGAPLSSVTHPLSQALLTAAAGKGFL